MAIDETVTDSPRFVSDSANPDGNMMDCVVGGSFSGNVHLQMQRPDSLLWHTIISRTSGFVELVASPDDACLYRFVVTNIKGTAELYLGPATTV